MLPEAFEVVKLTLFFTEDVNKDVAVVHQDPAAGRFAFDGNREPTVFLFDRLAHTVGNCLDLAVAVSGADDEKIGDDHVGAEVEENDVLGFLVFDGINDVVGKL